MGSTIVANKCLRYGHSSQSINIQSISSNLRALIYLSLAAPFFSMMLYSEHNHRLHAFAKIILVLSAVSFATTNAERSIPSSSELSILGTQRLLDSESHTLFPSTVDSLTDTPEDDWRQSLPPGLRNRNGAPLHRIQFNGAVIYLLGTSHVSRTSCDDARLLMQHVRPGE